MAVSLCAVIGNCLFKDNHAILEDTSRRLSSKSNTAMTYSMSVQLPPMLNVIAQRVPRTKYLLRRSYSAFRDQNNPSLRSTYYQIRCYSKNRIKIKHIRKLYKYSTKTKQNPHPSPLLINKHFTLS